MPGQPRTVLSPNTPTSWIFDRLREHQPLLDLLGTGPLESGGQSFTFAPIHKAGQLPPLLSDRYVVVRPPLRHITDYYVDLAPRRMESTYLVWGETRSDKLPVGLGFDDVLGPIFREIARALLGSSIPIEEPDALDGRVLQLAIIGAYTPQPATLTGTTKVAQMGHQLELLSTT
jgi:hypothetical protein